MSVHKQNMGTSVGQNSDPELRLSVEKSKGLSTSSFIVLEFTVENKGEDFKKFDEVSFSLGPGLEEKVKLVVGSDLVSWSEGIKNKIERKNHNFRVFIAGLSAVAAATAVSAKNDKVSVAAESLLIAGAGIVTVRSFQQMRLNLKASEKSNAAGLIPESHMMYSPLSVPPGLFLKRYAVFHVKSVDQVDFRSIGIKFGSGDKSLSYKLPFQEASAEFLSEKGSSDSLVCKTGEPLVRKPIVFRGKSLLCLSNCNFFHPLNRKACQQAVGKKLR